MNCRIYLVCLLSMLTSGCTVFFLSAGGVSDNSLLAIQGLNGEPTGFGAYTYVILPEDQGHGAGIASDLANRYEKLLDAIKNGTSSKPVPQDERAYYNAFIVPVLPNSDQPQDIVASYDSDTALGYLRIARDATQGNKKLHDLLSDSNSPGPYLITTQAPISTINTGDPILIADLTRMNPDEMNDFVAEYKNKLESNTLPATQQLFSSLKVKLVSFLLDVSETLNVVQAVMPSAEANGRD